MNARSRRLSGLPLWRLIVALYDAERTVGPGSSTARALAHALRDRLRRRPDIRQGVRREA